ncbi:hypothetical protein Dsin_026196 [Dipteronia sinensis]|uniref:Uncharacterized protein n=1 Tax=Dipteronia sinensis TaxID=43782 RepID=A0AAD9ZXV5_9ROSI|nr:hypothetical protein Dsin_026196 [Dipteronia sinensis]
MIAIRYGGNKVAVGHVAANTPQGGCMVKSQNIEKLRNSSGATIVILAPNQFPLFASAHESDRVVENPPLQVISISSTYNYSADNQSCSLISNLQDGDFGYTGLCADRQMWLQHIKD